MRGYKLVNMDTKILYKYIFNKGFKVCTLNGKITLVAEIDKNDELVMNFIYRNINKNYYNIDIEDDLKFGKILICVEEDN